MRIPRRRLVRAWWWLLTALLLIGACGTCRADPVKGEATLSATGGYARLVLKLADDVESEVTTAGSILVIRFKQPVDIPVDQLSDAVPDYVTSARRDPDGSAIRLSLARRVTVNTMSAGERVFIDLLPDGWSGPPPSLPPEVIRELAERARAAERALRLQRAAAAAQKRPPIRVRASVQPTFVRYVFEMPSGVNVSSVLNDQKLTLQFNALLNFDLADAKVAAPSNVASISQKVDGETSAVEIKLIGDVDVHSFREDKNYIIDIAFQQSGKSAALSPAAAALSAAAAAVPAAAAPANAAPAAAAAAQAAPEGSEKPHGEKPVPQKSGEAAPVPEKMDRSADALSTRAGAMAQPAPVVATALAREPETPKPTPSIREATALPAPVPPKVQPPTHPPPGARSDGKAVTIRTERDGDGLHLAFSFATTTPAALFRRADTLWLVFDSTMPLDLAPIRASDGSIIADANLLPLDRGEAVRIRLRRPQMPSLVGSNEDGATKWTVTFADTMQAPTEPLSVNRTISDPAHAKVAVSLSNPGRLYRFVDPEAGDALIVVTAPPPVRGFVKRQDFVELSLLESIHGIAVHPNSDDVTVEASADKILLGRPGGLTLSSAETAADRAPTALRPIFDVEAWRRNQQAAFIAREDALISAAAAAEPDRRMPARIDLARFYLSRAMYPEAKGVLDLALAEVKPELQDPVALIVHSVASTLMGRPELALQDLASAAIGTKYDPQLWKALAEARLGKWAKAREKFKNTESAITSLPIDLQRIVILAAMRAALEVRDYSGAAKRDSDLQIIGLSPEQTPAAAVLRGRLAEALGHEADALSDYRVAVDSEDRAAAAEAKLYEIALKQKRNEISQADATRELEILSVMWRGDGLEVRTLEMLARLYSDAGRFAESLAAVRTATRLEPNSELARQGQDEGAALFAQIFLGSKGDDLPPVDALAMFYEFREFTPIGRRGDEMIRRLADRLVAVDLLDQASELLQYQVDHRLEGAARAQVAARLAMVYLTSRKPDRAIAALRTTRISDLSGELRQERLLLEARAESDVGRRDLALDIISNINSREAIRLRSDIYWASRRWREASEQIELYYGDRWRDFRPLTAVEKGDVIRALVGYALAEDAIGLARFREKYAPFMSGDADRAAFETASKPAAASSAEFGAIAKLAASVDTLDGFLREMKTRFPDSTARATVPPQTARDDQPTGSLPAITGSKRADAAR
jgi:hypothetical protein